MRSLDRLGEATVLEAVALAEVARESLQPRFSELRAMGMVEPTGARRRKGNGKIDDQSHATGTAGIGPALLGADPFGNGVPIPSREGPEAVPYARGHESGSA